MRDLYKGRGFDKFSYVIVTDLENENAFDEAVVGVRRGRAHCLAFHWNVDKSDDFIKPAVAGTVSVMKAASMEPKVQWIVITSSYARGRRNKQSIDAVNTEDVDAWRMHWYRASKTLAERAAWDHVEKEKPTYDLATTCPPYVLGPIIHEAASSMSLNTFYPSEQLGLTALTFTLQVLIDHVRTQPHLVEAFAKLVDGTPGAPVPPQNWFDCSRSLKTLGMTPTPDKSTAIDMTKRLLAWQKQWTSQGL
ncbi:hypothetical protein Q5752_004741 [Cryptotrichosporon argae]